MTSTEVWNSNWGDKCPVKKFPLRCLKSYPAVGEQWTEERGRKEGGGRRKEGGGEGIKRIFKLEGVETSHVIFSLTRRKKEKEERLTMITLSCRKMNDGK